MILRSLFLCVVHDKGYYYIYDCYASLLCEVLVLYGQFQCVTGGCMFCIGKGNMSFFW